MHYYWSNALKNVLIVTGVICKIFVKYKNKIKFTFHVLRKQWGNDLSFKTA